MQQLAILLLFYDRPSRIKLNCTFQRINIVKAYPFRIKLNCTFQRINIVKVYPFHCNETI